MFRGVFIDTVSVGCPALQIWPKKVSTADDSSSEVTDILKQKLRDLGFPL